MQKILVYLIVPWISFPNHYALRLHLQNHEGYYRKKKETAKILIRRFKLIINKRPYCMSDYDHSPVFTTEFKKWDAANLTTLKENTDTLKQKMSKLEKTILHKNIALYSTIEIPASMATPAPPMVNLSNKSYSNINLES